MLMSVGSRKVRGVRVLSELRDLLLGGTERARVTYYVLVAMVVGLGVLRGVTVLRIVLVLLFLRRGLRL